MIFISQAQIDALLLEDIQGGDLTTRALNIGHQPGYIEFFHRQGGCVSGVSLACKMLTTLGLTIDDAVSDGSQADAGQRLIQPTATLQHFIRDGKRSRTYWSGVAASQIISLKCWRCFVNVILTAISPAPEKLSLEPGCWQHKLSLPLAG